MSSAQTLEAQIGRKERDIEKQKRAVAELEEKLRELKEEMGERDENFENLDERVAVSTDEIKTKDAELHETRDEYERRHAAKYGGGVLDAQIELRNQRAASLAPREAIDILIKHAQAVKQRITGKSQESMDEGDGRLLGQITVFYENTGDAATFRLTATYTFGQLNEDACRYWGINPMYGTLRDEFHALWPQQAMVQRELASVGEVPKVYLVDSAPGGGVSADAVKTAGGRRSLPAGGHPGDAQGGKQMDDSSDDDEDRDEDEPEPEEIVEYRRAVDETKKQMATNLSPFWHGPKYSQAAQKFKGFHNTAENEKTRRREEHMHNCGGLVLHALFLVAILYPLSFRLGVLETHDMYNSVAETFLHQRFRAPSAPEDTSSFMEMNSVDQVYSFMEDVLQPGLFQRQTYSGRFLSMGEQGLVRGANQLVGGVRLRQYRVQNDSCEVAPQFEALKTHGCYRPYSFDRQEQEPFGPGIEVEGFTWAEAYSINAHITVSSEAYYDKTGYAAELPNEAGKANLVLRNLREYSWLDRHTRALIVAFNLLNVNFNKYAMVQLLIEFDPAGGLRSFQDIDIVTLSMYGGDSSMILIACDTFALIYAVFTVYSASTEGMVFGVKAFLGTVWNLLDVGNCIFIITLTTLRALYDSVMVVQLDPQVPHYVQVSHIVDMYHSITTMYAVVAMVAVFSTLKFLRANASISRVYQTLAVASGNLGAYFFIFGVTLLAFVLAAFFLFGAELPQFSTPTGAMQEVVFMLTGRMQYEDMRRVDSVVAPVYFIIFVFTVFFVMVNFFLAIINDAYYTVNNTIEWRKEQYWAALLTSPFSALNKDGVRVDPKKQLAKQKKAEEKARKEARKRAKLAAKAASKAAK